MRNGPIDGSIKTGSLLAVRNLYRSLAEDGEWFDFEIAVRDKNIVVSINGTNVVWYTEPMTPYRTLIHEQKRIGKDQKHFMMLKFRTMRTDTPKDTATHLLTDPQKYITKVGRFLRKTSLDELPQLFNILKGEMSFVGPRPELLLYTTQYTKEQECIMWVRPGITDRSSIVYIAQDEIVGTENPVENYEKYILPEKNRLRVEYAKNQSFLLDMQLFFETIGGVFGTAKKMAEEKKEDRHA